MHPFLQPKNNAIIFDIILIKTLFFFFKLNQERRHKKKSIEVAACMVPDNVRYDSWWMQFCILLDGKLCVCLSELVRLKAGIEMFQHHLSTFYSIAVSELINWECRQNSHLSMETHPGYESHGVLPVTPYGGYSFSMGKIQFFGTEVSK